MNTNNTHLFTYIRNALQARHNNADSSHHIALRIRIADLACSFTRIVPHNPLSPAFPLLPELPKHSTIQRCDLRFHTVTSQAICVESGRAKRARSSPDLPDQLRLVPRFRSLAAVWNRLGDSLLQILVCDRMGLARMLVTQRS